MRETRLDERALLRVGQVLLEGPVELLARDRRVVLLADPAAHAHHVGERPVRDTVTVGEAPATVPVRRLRDAVEVLVELPREPRLADARDAGHREKVRLPALGRFVEEILGAPEVAVAANERRFQPGRLELAARAGHDAKRPPQFRRLVLALERMGAGALVDHRLLGRAARGISDEDRARLRR